MEQYIILKHVRFYAYHGVAPQERITGAYFILDLRVKYNFTEALENDNLKGTLNYAELYQTVKKEMDIPSLLLEHLGGRIVKSLKKTFKSIQEIDLTILKENPPMGADCAGAGIEIHCK